MKNKIALKLAFYFSASLTLLAVIIGVVFVTLFRNQTLKEQKNDMETRAVSIAETLSEYMSGSKGNGLISKGMMGTGTGGGYGMYLRFIDDIAMTDVWLVDEELNLITSHMADYTYADLPQDAGLVVQEVFDGKTTFSKGFSDLLQTPTLTVGTPIKVKDTVVGAVLLHAPVKGLEEASAQGISLLIISILAALAVSLALSLFLAFSLTKPLKKMKNAALLLAEGDYTAKTGISQNDEIGELAGTIDILSIRLAEAKQQSEQFDRLRRDFVANISHELKTPVTVLRGSLEALCDEVVTQPEQVREYHRQMLGESVFLQRLVNDLLDLSKLQNTDFRIDMEELSLNELLADCARSARQMAQEKSIDIRMDLDTAQVAIKGDYGRLRQMFLIVVDNAVKFSPKGGAVMIDLQGKTVRIRDHGPGIAEEDLPYIFDRFYKSKSAENKSGTGLGLAIAKQIAERHHIEVSVVSSEKEGTAFTFQF